MVFMKISGRIEVNSLKFAYYKKRTLDTIPKKKFSLHKNIFKLQATKFNVILNSSFFFALKGYSLLPFSRYKSFLLSDS